MNIVLEGKHFSIARVGDGAFAAIMKEGGGAVGNCGFVDIGESVVVFDSSNTQQSAKELVDAIAEFVHKPVSHLVNSHWHGDHVRGNQIFRDVPIISTERTRLEMEKRHPARIAKQKASLAELQQAILDMEAQLRETTDVAAERRLMNQVSFLREIDESLLTLELVLPTETFDSVWSVHGKRRTVECFTLGGGHTSSDTVMMVPDESICFVGDLVAVSNHMLTVDGNVDSWIAILNQLNGMGIESIVPGHGPVGTKEWISTASCYLRDLKKIVKELRESGIKPEQVTTKDIPEPYRAWAAESVYVQNIKHLVAQSDESR